MEHGLAANVDPEWDQWEFNHHYVGLTPHESRKRLVTPGAPRKIARSRRFVRGIVYLHPDGRVVRRLDDEFEPHHDVNQE